jgi:hypothetical protein
MERAVSTKQKYPLEFVNGLALNEEQRLYVIDNGYGVSCFGFDNCFQESQQLAQVMEMAGPTPDMLGTRECYTLNKSLHAAFATHPASKKTWYRAGTPKKVAAILEAARCSYSDNGDQATILRLFYGDPATGRDWIDEFETTGFIGRSMGPMRVPLIMEPLLDDVRDITSSNYSGAINTVNVLRIIDVRRAEEVYRAKNYVLPQFAIEVKEGKASHPVEVKREGKTVAAFTGHEEAAEWIAFIQGFRVHQAFRSVTEHAAELVD